MPTVWDGKGGRGADDWSIYDYDNAYEYDYNYTYIVIFIMRMIMILIIIMIINWLKLMENLPSYWWTLTMPSYDHNNQRGSHFNGHLFLWHH